MAQTSASVLIEIDASLAARDGCILRSDIYRPNDDARHPVLLARTAYDKSAPLYVNRGIELARAGYVAVMQDIRGRGVSGGTWAWFYDPAMATVEARDGYDTVEWAARLDGSDGRVGMWGNSYLAVTAWLALSAGPPSLASMFVSGQPDTLQRQNFGSYELASRFDWPRKMIAASIYGPLREKRAARLRAAFENEWLGERAKWLKWLPLSELPEHVFGHLSKAIKTDMAHPTRRHPDLRNIYPRVNIPVCQFTGWWDREGGNIENYLGAVQQGVKSVRKQHRLIVGPYSHAHDGLGRKMGAVDYGPDADLDYMDFVQDWFDWSLKAKSSRFHGDSEPVAIFILNENSWRHEATWPLDTMRCRELYLSSNGDANSVGGNGRLQWEPARDSPPDSYTYDPQHPVPSLSELGLGFGGLPGGHAVDQSPLNERQDILVFQTPPLAEDLLLCGPLELRLWASSSAIDTDFFAKLVEVRVDGTAVNISFGMIRARYRRGFEAEVMLIPGQIEQFVVEMRPIGIRFLKGSRLRLDVTSSDFPYMDRNHNTGRPFHTDKELQIARQTIYHDAARPSCLLLPVIIDGSLSS